MATKYYTENELHFAIRQSETNAVNNFLEAALTELGATRQDNCIDLVTNHLAGYARKWCVDPALFLNQLGDAILEAADELCQLPDPEPEPVAE